MLESAEEIILTKEFLLLVIFVFGGYGAIEYFLLSRSRPTKGVPLNMDESLGVTKETKEHLRELEEIKKQMEESSGPIKLDAVTTLYIARHWDEYNLLGSEDGKIIFEKLKEVQDTIDGKVVNEKLIKNSSDEKTRTTKIKCPLPSSLTLRYTIEIAGTRFIAKEKKRIFEGWPKLSKSEEDEVIIPTLEPGENLKLESVYSVKAPHQRPPRFGVGRFVSTLLKMGLVRPSTMDQIVEKLVDKHYITIQRK